MIKLILFDFDGTISDCRKIAIKNLLYVLDNHKYQFNKEKAVSLLGIKMQQIFRKLNLPNKDLEKVRKEFYNLMLKDVNKIKLCVSVKPLEKLKNKYKIAVISNSEDKFLIKSAKKLKVERLFLGFHGAEEFSSKDKEIRNLIRKYKEKPSETMYLGDRFSDVDSAKKAGCISVAIHNKCSWSTLPEILKKKPDYIISDFYDLETLLEVLDK